MTAAWEVLGWIAMACIAAGLVLLVAFIATAVIKAIRDGWFDPDDPQLIELTAQEQVALYLGERLLDRAPEPGAEVWLRVTCCSADTCTGKHVTIQPLPTLKEL